MDAAKELKEQGNQLYKQEKFVEALQRYSEASALQPQDPVYHSNISAVQYEIGKYADCVCTIDTALSLLAPPSPSNPQLATRLLLRKAKSLFYSKKLKECKDTLAQLTRECESAGIANLDTDGTLAKALEQEFPDYPQFSICRSTCDTRSGEYYIVGHDRSVSAFSAPLTHEQLQTLRALPDQESFAKMHHQFSLEAPLRIHFNTPQQSFAFLFGGIGDARHLFESLTELGALCPPSTTKRFHFTMVDIKHTVIARDLVMFYIFKRLLHFSLEQMRQDTTAIENLALAHFAYLGLAMPEYLHEKLLQTINELISDLENKSLPSWLYVHESTVPGVLSYLHDWLDFKMPVRDILKRMHGEDSEKADSMLHEDLMKSHLPEGFEDPTKQVKEQMSKICMRNYCRRSPSLFPI
jgi:tetratricopeptide (TPR) repeat protein